MRVDIITMDAVPNYGSVLQAYATKRTLEKQNCEVRIINYVRKNERYENLPSTWSNGNIAKRIIIFPTIRKWQKVFGDFRKNQLGVSGNIYTTDEDFSRFPIEADAYCTGSDQVWNSVWNEGIILPLYLSFIPPEKYRFSLASSFGQTSLSIDEVDQTKEYIGRYNHISVREKTGVNILKDQYHYDNAIQLIDPSLFLRADEWRSLAPKPRIKSPYILIYNLNRSKAFDRYAVELSNRTKTRLIRFCTRYDQFYRPGKSILIPSVFEFITLIDNARYVLTDSFHATAFSLNMGTEPICVFPNEFSGRISDFLELTNSQQRHVNSYNDFDIVKRTTDFNTVNTILDNEREKAMKYIGLVVSEIKQLKCGDN